jgi:hypothetical protein
MRLRTPAPFSFETLIEDLFEGADRFDGAPKPAHRLSIDSLEAAWELAANSRGTLASSKHEGEKLRCSFYGYDRAEGANDVSLDPNVIINELGLFPGASESDVAMLRRQFALRNHPDRVPAELRSLATQRMMIANDLIDRHIARKKKSTGSDKAFE